MIYLNIYKYPKIIITKEKRRKMKSKSIFAVLAIAIVLAMTINVAYAGTATSASITMVNGVGTPVSQYAIGETIRVKVETTNAPGATVDLQIKDFSTGVPVSVLIPGAVAGSIVDFPALPQGHYRVYANDVPVGIGFIATASFFVVPESMLGTLTATVAGFAAFATIGIVKRKHAKSK